jgi:hypothetical protein
MKRLVALAVLTLVLSSAPSVLAGDTIIVIKDGRPVAQQSAGDTIIVIKDGRSESAFATVVAMQILGTLLAI